MYFDRFDIVEAHFCFCMDYHGGMGDALYHRMTRIREDMQFRAGPMLCYERLTENGQAIYDNLVAKHNITATRCEA